mgnify:FL=1
MFIDVNYRKKPQKAKLHIAKPNKQIISHLSEKYADNLALKLGNINELNFSIPHFIEDDLRGVIKNPHVDTIKEKMLIRVSMGAYKEWYIVDGIEEDSDTDSFNVTTFSLGYELKGKRVSGFETESMNATEMITQFLEVDEITKKSKTTSWNIGTIDPMFDGTFRSFESGDDTNILDCITQWAETFGGLLIWDTNTRRISLTNMSENGKFRGMTVDYGKLLNSIKRIRTTDEMITRLWVYGSEDLSIHSVNPTGQGYIEDFSYFMYPFERDANRNVIKSSHFMSDELCHAILDHKSLVEANAPNINEITSELSAKTIELVTEESKLIDLESELKSILELLDTAQAVLSKLESEVPKPDVTEETALVAQKKADRDSKNIQIASQQDIVNPIIVEVESLKSQLNTLQDEISNQANFTEEILDELNLFVHTSTWRDDRYIDVNELYNDALVKFIELREPKVVIETSIDNLMGVVEEQYYWDKLVLGDLIKVKYPQMNIEYMAKIIEINYDLENGEVSLVIANTKDLLSETDKLVQLLYSNSSASSLVQNNKYKWDKVNALSNQVNSLITSEWDATKNKIIAGVNNSVEVGNRGIIIRNPDFPDEVVIMQSGVIALSKDNGETWKTAIKPDGIVAERLIGQIIAGQELMITNNSGSFTMDENGAVFDVNSFKIRSSSGSNLVDRWQTFSDFVDEYKDDNLITAYEKKMLVIKWEEMAKRYIANNERLNAYYVDGGTSLQFVNDYHYSYDELYDYLFVTPHGDKPLLAQDNLIYTTRIVSTEFESKFRVYDTNLVELEKQLSFKAKSLTDDALQDIQDDINEVMDDVVYKTEILSSNGDKFNNGVIDTTIFVVVYRGKENITSTLASSAFKWRKKNRYGVIDTAWGMAHVNVGSTFQITHTDVDKKATFECDIEV